MFQRVSNTTDPSAPQRASPEPRQPQPRMAPRGPSALGAQEAKAGGAGDPLEREAGGAAESVMRGREPGTAAAAKTATGFSVNAVLRAPAPVARAPVPMAPPGAGTADFGGPSGSEPSLLETRQFFEPRFGRPPGHAGASPGTNGTTPRFEPHLSSLTIQRKCAPGCDCPSCTAAKEDSLGVQTKLTIGEPGDFYERQADSIAAAVMSPAGAIPMPPMPAAPAPSPVERHGSERNGIRRHSAGGAGRSPLVLSPENLTSGGAPLPSAVRGFFEPRFGRNFSQVRVHSGSFSEAANSALQSHAFTYGQHIWLGRGQAVTANPILAHEMVHTMQQGSMEKVRRQSPAPAPAKPAEAQPVSYTIKVPTGLTSGVELLRYAETQIFGRVVNLQWTPTSPGAKSVFDDPAAHVGQSITFAVAASKVAQFGGGKPSEEATAASDTIYAALSQGDRDAINDEIDRRYYSSTGETPGTLIKKDEKGKIAIWNSFKQQVLADKQKLDAMPDAIKTFLGGPSNFTPAQFDILVRLAGKLSNLSAADLDDYKSKTNAATSDLAELEASVDRYLAAKAQREAAGQERENIVTKLFGAEDLYEQYKKLGQASAELNKKADDKQAQGLGDKANELREQARKIDAEEVRDLTAKLKDFDFGSIAEFQHYLDAYEQAFLKESVAIAFDVLDQFEHKLFEAEKQYSQDAAIDALLAQVQASGAPQLVEQAKEKMAEASELSDKGRLATVQGSGDVGNRLSDEAGKKENEAQGLITQGSQAVKALPGQPLIQDEKFPRADLLSNDRGKAKTAILAYIAARRDDIKTCRQDLRDDPKIVYKLPKVFAMSVDRQGIVPGSITDKLINDRRSAYIGDEALWGLVLVVVGIALAVLIPGGGLVAAAAALGGLGISGYQAIQEYEDYKQKSAFAGVGLADDPSVFWVIVAVVGAFADLGSALAAVEAVKASGALKALEATGDLTQFEKDLAAIKELNQASRTKLLRAAEAQTQARKALTELAASTGQLNAAIIPGLQQAGHLGVAAYYSIKSGVLKFGAWLDELKAAKIITSVDKLAPEDLKALKAAWQEGREYTKSIQSNIPELEEAMKEFRAETGIDRAVTTKGRVQGGTTAAAKAEVEGVPQSLFTEGSTKSKGATAATVKTNPRYASPQSFGGTKNHAEQNILGEIADEIDKAKNFDAALKGTAKPGVTGKIHLHVEQEVCSACRQGLANPDVLPGVVKQFSGEYPNVTIVITNARTSETMFVRGGKAVIM